MIHEAEVRKRLAAVANGKLQLFDFADWLDSESWNMHRDSPGAVRLVSSVDRMMAEYDHHHDLSVLRAEVVSLLSNVVIDASMSDAPVAVSRRTAISFRTLIPLHMPPAHQGSGFASTSSNATGVQFALQP